MLLVNWPIVDTIYSKGNKFVTCVKIKATGDLMTALMWACGLTNLSILLLNMSLEDSQDSCKENCLNFS